MRRLASTRSAALAAALAAGALAAYTLRPTAGSSSFVQPQAAIVRTQVIRRTVHIVRHERPPRGRRTARTRVTVHNATVLAPAGAPRTGTSGSHAGAAAAPTVVPGGAAAPRTRTSGVGVAVAPATTPATGVSGAPVRTRTSRAAAAGSPSTGAAAPVRTRTSGGSAGSGSKGGALRTRTSGGGHDGEGGRDD